MMKWLNKNIEGFAYGYLIGFLFCGITILLRGI